MAVCDICNAPGMGTLVSSDQMREAVYQNGFDPFKLGLAGGAGEIMGISKAQQFEHWKNNIVAQDTSDWNVCSECMSVLESRLNNAPQATGVMHSDIPNPFMNVESSDEDSYENVEETSAEPKKKWWQFWK